MSAKRELSFLRHFWVPFYLHNLSVLEGDAKTYSCLVHPIFIGQMSSELAQLHFICKVGNYGH